MTGEWAATNTLRDHLRGNGYLPQHEPMVALALVEAALDAAEEHLTHTDRFCVDKDEEADLTCPTHRALAAALCAVREGK